MEKKCITWLNFSFESRGKALSSSLLYLGFFFFFFKVFATGGGSALLAELPHGTAGHPCCSVRRQVNGNLFSPSTFSILLLGMDAVNGKGTPNLLSMELPFLLTPPPFLHALEKIPWTQKPTSHRFFSPEKAAEDEDIQLMCLGGLLGRCF